MKLLLHRCGGLSKSTFVAVVDLTNSYPCPNCTALKQAKLITVLQDTILDLNKEVVCQSEENEFTC